MSLPGSGFLVEGTFSRELTENYVFFDYISGYTYVDSGLILFYVCIFKALFVSIEIHVFIYVCLSKA